jgi:hypothetical protein
MLKPPRNFNRMVLTMLVIAAISCQSGLLKNTNTRYIDPTIGNVAPLLNANRPIVHLPNQMIRL